MYKRQGYIGQIYDALDSNGYLDNTLLIILTDHGGIGTNHGGNTPEELNCSYYAKGKSVTPGEFTETLTTATLSSVVAAALGVPQSGEYDYTVPNGYFKGYTLSLIHILSYPSNGQRCGSTSNR